uniref:Intersectin 2b n=1 Tax=Gasterosteus aculeatus aculeatus TaxID=481459 RepID=A0AAQ4R6B1_GASAC
MNGGPSIWAISPEERVKHDKKFDTLSPSMGYVSGEQAKKFLLQSGLPGSVLAEIWTLADMNKDGKMDRLEFSIAMKLIKLKLQGTPLPSALPVIMKQPPVPAPSLSNPTSLLTNPAYGTIALLSAMQKSLTDVTSNISFGRSSRLLTGIPRSASPYSSPLGLSSSGMNKASSLLDLGSISSASSSPSLMSPMVNVPSDWAVPHASRLRYRQQFNSLDKQMAGYLSGQQVRGAMATTMLTQTQLASIWTLADVDKDGKLKAEEFILAMHLVDMAKIGQPLPLTLPTELIPPSQRGAVNGSSSSLYAALADGFDIEPPQKTKPNLSFEDKFKANLERGNAELEKRRQTLQDAERRERERRAQIEREEREKREKEAREIEERRRREEEIRLERQKEIERHNEEERLREIERKEAAQRELERQRKEEWERRRQGELKIKKEQEQDEIGRLKAKKKSLELELEAVGNKHQQISDRLRDFQNKKKLQNTELDLTNQRKETRQQDINNLQKQFEVRLCVSSFFFLGFIHETLHETKLRDNVVVTEKKGTCLKLREQLEALEKEAAAKLTEVDAYNRDMQEMRESQRKQQETLEKLRSIKEDKRRELSRRKEEEEQRKKREEERKKQQEEEIEKERQWQEKLRKDEEERQRQLREEKEAKQREEAEREKQALIQAAKEQVERELRVKEEAERKRREMEERKKREEDERQKQEERRRQDEERRLLEEERRQLEEERRKLEEDRRKEEKRRKDEEERRKREEERKRATEHRKSAALTSFKALYPFTARNNEELNFSADDVIEVDESTEREEGWLYGSRQGKMGWFPESYVERVAPSDAANSASSPPDASESSDSLQLEEYTALYTYESPEPSDLSFREGDLILVSKKDGEWWHGSIGDSKGVFPSNYVKPKEADTSSISGKKKPGKLIIAHVIRPRSTSSAEQLNLETAQLIVILGKNPSGWWLGELQARGKKRQKGWFPASHVKILGSSSGQSTPAPQTVCQVIAIYDYKAANGDELSFSKGQLINVHDKNDQDWWKGETNGATGLFPTNYVKMTTAECDPSQQWCADLNSLDSLSAQEKRRQGYIHELILTEDRYVEDLQIVLEVFHKPMSESGRLNDAEMEMIFVNWNELLTCNSKLLKALRARKKMGGENMPVQMIGDVLAAELSHMQPYIRFCSCQINGATLVQSRIDSEPNFKEFLKKIATDYRCKGMPLSSFLLKPMQRITRYPLHIKNILESTGEGHPDRGPLKEALEKAEELCQQVNEGVREKENSDRLEWIQSHLQFDGATENLVFNSLTNCLGPRKLLHSGKMNKVKSNKELFAFLFNDFLLLTHAAKQFSSSGPDKLFSSKNNVQLKIYKPPVLLNEVLVKLPDPSSDEPTFHISHIDRVYILRTDNINERTAWVQKIKAASEEFIETEKKKRDKAYQARSVKTSGIGRLLVTILEATELKPGKPNGKSNPYCEVTMGAQIFTSRTLNDTLNPRWNFNCQFNIKDLYQDVLCITIFERDQFSPDVFLGRTEVPVATIKKELENKGPVTRRLLLHEVPTGEVWVRLDLQLFGNK